MNKLIIYTVFIALMASCGFLESNASKENTKTIARVNNTYLFEEDFKEIFPKNLTNTDSALVARSIINSWAKQELLLQKAELNLPSNNVNLEKLVQKYRTDLFINSYKEALLKQQLDTVVTDAQIVGYYNDNKSGFKINEELVKFKFIRISPNSSSKKRLKKLFLARGQNDLYLLDEESDSFRDAFLNDSTWFRYKDLLNKLPALKKSNKETLLKTGKFLQLTDSLGLLYVQIKAVKQRNEIAPVRYIAKMIRPMILHKRKLEFIKEVEEVLVDDAIKNKQFEIYEYGN